MAGETPDAPGCQIPGGCWPEAEQKQERQVWLAECRDEAAGGGGKVLSVDAGVGAAKDGWSGDGAKWRQEYTISVFPREWDAVVPTPLSGLRLHLLGTA